jgi:S-adenosylmethionine:tRNA ribosyltransferase-isomerase
MKLSDFDYNLPKELIAQYPLKDRADARLLVLNRSKGTIEHLSFRDFPGFLKKDDLLVLNDSKVLSCRLIGKRKTGGKVELLLLGSKSELVFDALVKPARIKIGEKVYFGGNVSAVLSAKNEVTFQAKDKEEVYSLGVMPLPPYIKREPEEQDYDYYQTVYARHKGSIASPTAGLHFTPLILKEIKEKGINLAYVTLHVGYATFKPVKADDITKHAMGKEPFVINKETEKSIEEARSKKGKIFAVGTTSCRSLETYASGIKEGYTDLFIYPGYKFKIVDHLLTNFHLPKTTLFVLVCAFAGEKLARKAYSEAIDKKYRFYSYGDAMLII